MGLLQMLPAVCYYLLLQLLLLPFWGVGVHVHSHVFPVRTRTSSNKNQCGGSSSHVTNTTWITSE